MSDVKPITREEGLLDKREVEPTAREEAFIKRLYDKTQPTPKPRTRIEYFLAKAGEGGGGATIEQLDVSENGTYSEEGKAYSPVVVDVQPSLQRIEMNIIDNGSYTLHADQGYDGIGEAAVNVQVPKGSNADIHIRCLGVDGGTITITATDGSTTYTHSASVTLTDETVIFNNLEYAGTWTVSNSKDATTETVDNTFTEGNITLMVTKIPLMTSATTPYGECISSSNNWGEGYWRYLPFDGQNGSINNDGADAWTNQRGDNSPWIGYHFMDSNNDPIKVKMDKVWVQGFCVVWGNSTTRTLYFEGSNDGTNWEKIGLDKVFDFGINTRQSFEHELNGGKYEYFRIRFDASLNAVDSRWIFIERIQVYANDFAPLPTGALTATENGTYDPEDYDLSAFSSVTVNVSQGGDNPLKGMLERTVSVIDDSVLESIGAYAFYNYIKTAGSSENLTSVKFRNATSIGTNAFTNCTALTSVDFSKVPNIYTNTFSSCTSLDTLILRRSEGITMLSNINTFNNTPFASGGTGGTLYVPQALISSYQSASNWTTILGYPNNQIKPIEGSIYE